MFTYVLNFINESLSLDPFLDLFFIDFFDLLDLGFFAELWSLDEQIVLV